MKSTKKEQFFTQSLIEWASQNSRPLPWKGEKNPYYIWLSEIILQQTRVEQGLPYFEKFKTQFPSITDLANASEDEVMKLWQGLGYYSRARNLHFTAKYITYELNGVFPNTYKGILALKGVGPYTAAAIASFAFGLAYPVVDGNVYRVLSRFFGITTPIDITAGKKEINHLAMVLLKKDHPALYNQAIMDFGATQCLPTKPKCTSCPMQIYCTAYADNLIHLLPIKSKKIKKKERYFNYLVLKNEDKLFLKKRIQKDIWQNLYDFPLIETSYLLNYKQLQQKPIFKNIIGHHPFKLIRQSPPYKQVLTHQKIIAVFWEIAINFSLEENEQDIFEVNQKNINNFAFPKIIDLYLKDNSLYLELF